MIKNENNNNSKSEKKRQIIDLVRELKKLWNMKLTVIPIVFRELGTVPEGLEMQLRKLEIRGRTGII